MKNELKREFQKNQARIERSRKITKEERKKLIQRNREILNILYGEVKHETKQV